MPVKVRENIQIQDALDNLAAIASIDLNAPGPIGIWKGSRIVVDEEEFRGSDLMWLSGEGTETVLEVLDATFRAIHYHLVKLVDSPEMDWNDERQVRGVTAMVALAGECAIKMEKYLASRMGKSVGKIHDRPEYRSLQDFYLHHCASKIKKEEVAESGEQVLADVEAVRRDQDYELFYIRHEDGTPYFKKEVIRRMRLSCDFESISDTFEEDPLLQVRAMVDRDLQASAQQILGDCHVGIVEFYKLFRKVAENQLASSLSLALIALFLAGNPRSLLQNSTGKTCLQYFDDFHRFLRRCMKTPEYQKWIAYAPEETEKIPHALLHLTHSLCDSFFHRMGGVKQESIGLIHRTMRRGSEKAKKGLKKGETIWTQFLFEDETFRSLLMKFPNGPLFKVLDLIRAEQEEDQIIPFDPIGQENLPAKLYEIDVHGHRIDLLRIPSPTRQSLINKVELLDEFRGVLRSYQTARPVHRHLMINLQDRSSWKESCRCRVLETLQKNAEFSSVFSLLTLPKNTSFYHQNNEYLNLDDATAFFAAFLSLVDQPEQNGFCLPHSFKQADLKQFTEMALPLIHRCFFEKKKILSRRNREDFIEIYYHLFILKLLDKIEPDSLSFTCKDAIDTGAALNGSFYAFLKLLTTGLGDKKDQDFFRWLLYTPALFIRERAIDPERLNRTLSVLEQIDSSLNPETLRELGSLYSKNLFKTIQVS